MFVKRAYDVVGKILDDGKLSGYILNSTHTGKKVLVDRLFISDYVNKGLIRGYRCEGTGLNIHLVHKYGIEGQLMKCSADNLPKMPVIESNEQLGEENPLGKIVMMHSILYSPDDRYSRMPHLIGSIIKNTGNYSVIIGKDTIKPFQVKTVSRRDLLGAMMVRYKTNNLFNAELCKGAIKPTNELQKQSFIGYYVSFTQNDRINIVHENRNIRICDSDEMYTDLIEEFKSYTVRKRNCI